MDEQKNDALENMLSAIDEHNSDQPQNAQQETAEEKRLRFMTDEERREWSGISEWHDPADKPKPEPMENDGKFAMASMLCGIVSILIACIHISGMLFGIAAIVCGIIAKKKNETASGMIKAGIIMGCICLGLGAIRDVLWVMGRLFPPEAASDFFNLPSEIE